jgi:DNA-binding CsgD family transcriptional regulator
MLRPPLPTVKPPDAAALINDALLQVFLHWDTIENPLAYFWQTLRHAVSKQKQRHVHERRRLVAYAQQRRLHARGTARTAQHVADLLERVSPRQCQLLEWFAQGYEDPQVAAWLGTTLPTVRVARHNAYRAHGPSSTRRSMMAAISPVPDRRIIVLIVPDAVETQKESGKRPPTKSLSHPALP